MTQGLEQSLTAATHNPNSIFSNEDGPWILLRLNGLSLARTEQFRDINEIDGFIRAGVALTLSSKFARRLRSYFLTIVTFRSSTRC